MSKETPTPKEPEQEGAFTRLLNYIKSSRPVQATLELGNSIIESKAVKYAQEKFGEFQETAAYKVLTGRAVGTAISLTFGSMALAGVGLVALPVAIVGMVAIGVGIVVDITTIRGSRQLHQENEIVVKHRAAKSKQDVFLKLEPDLAKALEKDLYHPQREGKRSVTQRYIEDSVIDSSTLNYGKAALKSSISAVAATAKAVGSGNPVSMATTAVTTAFGMYSEASTTHQIVGKQLENQRNIDAERNKPDTPGYDNRKELKAATREQRIQTMALEKLITEKPNKETYPPTGSFRHGTPEQIQNRFKAIKEEVAAKEKAVNTSRHPVVAFARSVGKDILRTYNPFSKFTTPEKLVVPEHTPLSKAVEKHGAPQLPKQKESAKEVSVAHTKTLHSIKKDLAPHKVESKRHRANSTPPKPKTTNEKGITK